MFGFLKKDDTAILREQVRKKLIVSLEGKFLTDYLILSKKILKVSSKKFIAKYADYVISKNSKDMEDLLEMTKVIDNQKVDTYLTKRLDPEFAGGFINYVSIDSLSEESFARNKERISENVSLKEIVAEEFAKGTVPEYVTKKIRDDLSNLVPLAKYWLYKLVIENDFIILSDTKHSYVYLNERNVSPYTLKSISYFITDKNAYTIVNVSTGMFAEMESEISKYRQEAIRGLGQIENKFLLAYLVNKMTDKNYGDLNFTYFGKNEFNKHKINCSVRYKNKYRFLEIPGISNVDINGLDSDIISLGGQLGGFVTVTNIFVGNFSFRALIVRGNGFYMLVLRKTEGVEYTIEELNDKANGQFDDYVIKQGNQIVYLNPLKKLDHFKIDYPLGYAEHDVDLFFNKINNAIVGTFWINGRTGSWKSTSLKNLLVKYYEANREKNKENKSVLLLENPMEGNDYYFKQVQIDDLDVEDYKMIMSGIKRADLDLCVVGELRTSDVFPVVNELSQSIPVFLTYHVGTIEKFLSMLNFYVEKSGGLKFDDVLSNVNVSLCQIPVEMEKMTSRAPKLFAENEKDELLQIIFDTFNVQLDEEEVENANMTRFQKALSDFVEALWTRKNYPLKAFTDSRYELEYEMLTGDTVKVFLEEKCTEYSKIYDYMGYSKSILYKTLLSFANGRILFKDVKIGEYSFETRIKTLSLITEQIRNGKFDETHISKYALKNKRETDISENGKTKILIS